MITCSDSETAKENFAAGASISRFEVEPISAVCLRVRRRDAAADLDGAGRRRRDGVTAAAIGVGDTATAAPRTH